MKTTSQFLFLMMASLVATAVSLPLAQALGLSAGAAAAGAGGMIGSLWAALRAPRKKDFEVLADELRS